MNYETQLMQYYINEDSELNEHYYLYEKLSEQQRRLILKKMSVDISNVFEKLERKNKARYIRDCNSLVYVKQCLTHEDHKEYIVNYCKDRFCPICSHVKSRKQTEVLKALFESMQKDNNYKNSYLLFVTLTKKNSVVGTLKDSVEDSSVALSKLLKTDPLFKSYKTKKKNGKTVVNKPLCQGTIIKKECTAKYNPKTKQIEFNDHIHMLLLVRKDYWNQKAKQWNHKKLGKTWKKALGVDYTPVVWVSLVRNGNLTNAEAEFTNKIDGKEAKKEKNNFASLYSDGSLKEIAKYECKDSDMLPMSENASGKVEINWNDAKVILNELYIAYYRKKTLTFTGAFNKQKERLFGLKGEDEDIEEDSSKEFLLDTFERKTCKKCGSKVEDQLFSFNLRDRKYNRVSQYSLNHYKDAERIRILRLAEAKREKQRVIEILNNRPLPPKFDKTEVWEENYIVIPLESQACLNLNQWIIGY